MHQKMLITVGKGKESPILIYNLSTYEIQYSFHVETQIFQILTPLLGSFEMDS